MLNVTLQRTAFIDGKKQKNFDREANCCRAEPNYRTYCYIEFRRIFLHNV